MAAGAPPFLLEIPTDTARTICSLVFTGTLQRFPDISFIFSHAGGTIMNVAGRIDDLGRFAERCARFIPNGFFAELSKMYFDTAGAYDAAAMGALRAVVPNAHILFGSDYPFVPIAATAGGLRKLGLPDDELAAIERGNAAALLPRWRA
jgi:predicted TIM-barrel fold metal-dependent hydrolase